MFGLRHKDERTGEQDAPAQHGDGAAARAAAETSRMRDRRHQSRGRVHGSVPSLQVIVAHEGRQKTRTYPLTNARTTVGSDPENDIVIAVPPMPRFYIAVRRLGPGGQYLVESVGENALNVQGATTHEHVLAPGDALRLEDESGAAITLVFVAPGSGYSRAGDRHALPATPLVGETIGIGRASDNQVVVDEPLVAQHHARLEHQGGPGYIIRDLDTVGGTYLNGMPVHETALRAGDRIRVGRSTFIFTGDALLHAPTTVKHEVEGVRVDARDLCEQVRAGGFLGLKQKVLLDNVSLSIPPGAFVALVGGSGTGKTTLLNALSGQRPADAGEVFFNGVNLYENFATLGAAMGYVPQDDIIHLNITVERALYYSARLRLPGLSRRRIRQRVEEVLRDVELLPQRGQLVSDLSGGQRKRVNIAVELLAKPAVFFLDEPTSGLDPGLDRKMMQLLRRLADRGHTIVLATHTTGNIDACDLVCFLAPGGRLAYYGPPEHLRQHFQLDEIASIYNALETDPAGWAERFKSSREYREYVQQPMSGSQGDGDGTPGSAKPAPATPPAVQLAGAREVGAVEGAAPAPEANGAPAQVAPQTKTLGSIQEAQRPGFVRQITVLTHRYTGLLVRDYVNLAILLAQAPIIAALVVVLADQNVVRHAFEGVSPPPDLYAQRALFIIVASGVWFGIINAARELVKERPIYLRERAVYLSVVPYVLSKLVVLSVLSAIQSFILLYIVGMRIGYPTHGLIWPGLRGAFAEMYITVWLVALSGLALGLCISALAPNSDRALSFVPIALVPQIIFGSVTFALTGTGAKMISWVVATRWGTEALGSIAHLHGRFTDQTSTFFQWDVGHLLGYWGALAALTIGFLLLTLLFLRLQDHRG